MRTITDEKVKKYLDATDKAIMQLAFCDAAAQLLGEFTHQTMQNVAQVDMEMIESIREVIKSGSPDATILDAVEEISYATSTRAEEFATSTVWKRIHTIRAGKTTLGSLFPTQTNSTM